MNPKRKIYLMMNNVPGLSMLTKIAMKLNLMLFILMRENRENTTEVRIPKKRITLSALVAVRKGFFQHIIM